MLQKLNNQYVILARDVSVDANDNSLSLLKIVDKLDVGLPADAYKAVVNNPDSVINPPINTSIASCFGIEDYADRDIDFNIVLSVISPLKKELVSFNQAVTIKKGTDKVRINVNLQGMPLDASGKYTFYVTAFSKNKEIAKGFCALEVNIFEQNN